MKIRTTMAALAVATAGIAGATASVSAGNATVSPADRDSAVIDATKPDRTGDLHVDGTAKHRMPRAVRHSIDLSQIDVHVDRLANTLSITHSLHRVLPADSPYVQFVITNIGDDAVRNGADFPFADVVTRLDQPWRIWVFSATGSNADDFAATRCRRGSVTVRPRRDTVTQVVPFRCFDSALTEGYVRSAALAAHPRGRKVAFDFTRWTRELPFTKFVSPTPTEPTPSEPTPTTPAAAQRGAAARGETTPAPFDSWAISRVETLLSSR